MKKEKSIQADIEVLRGLRNTPYPRPKQQDAIDRAISWGEAMRDAKLILSKVEMPEGKLKTKLHIETLEIKLAKALKENKELRKKIKELEDEISRKNSL